MCVTREPTENVTTIEIVHFFLQTGRLFKDLKPTVDFRYFYISDRAIKESASYVDVTIELILDISPSSSISNMVVAASTCNVFFTSHD